MGVERYADKAARCLPYLAEKLTPLPRNKNLRTRSTGDFQWQNKAMELAESLRQKTEIQGAFIVNMASTGCGKTMTNLKVMYALADSSDAPDSFGLRCSFALGLRVLTRQTGAEYRNRLGLGDDAVAVLAGGAAMHKLYEHSQDEDKSSVRSIIQLAGRLWRHRLHLLLECIEPNIILLDHNYKSLELHGQCKPAYWHPGFEDDADFLLKDHSLSVLLREKEYQAITSIPRLLPAEDFDFKKRLADLEHERLQRLLIAPPPTSAGRLGGGSSLVGAYSCWRHPQAMLSGALQKKHPFREDSYEKETDLYLRPDEEGETYTLYRLLEKKSGHVNFDMAIPHLLTRRQRRFFYVRCMAPPLWAYRAGGFGLPVPLVPVC